jgi:hypothetical protein
MLIIPEYNKALRAALEAFYYGPSEEEAQRILHELQHGMAELFILVHGRVGGEGESRISANDLKLMQVEGGGNIRVIMATTRLFPESLAPELEGNGLYCRRLPAQELLRLCIERGILSISLESGLETEVFIGPIGTGEPMRVVSYKELYGDDPL